MIKLAIVFIKNVLVLVLFYLWNEFINDKLNKKYWDKIKVLLILNKNQICLIHMS